MSDDNPVSGPYPDLCPNPCYGSYPCPVDVSIAFSTCEIVNAVVAYRAAIGALRTVKESGDVDAVAGAEKTLKASLRDLLIACEDYLDYRVTPVADSWKKVADSQNKPLWIRAYRDLEAAIVSTNLSDNSTTVAMRVYHMTRSAIESIENAVEALSTIEARNAIEAINSS